MKKSVGKDTILVKQAPKDLPARVKSAYNFFTIDYYNKLPPDANKTGILAQVADKWK